GEWVAAQVEAEEGAAAGAVAAEVAGDHRLDDVDAAVAVDRQRSLLEPAEIAARRVEQGCAAELGQQARQLAAQDRGGLEARARSRGGLLAAPGVAPVDRGEDGLGAAPAQRQRAREVGPGGGLGEAAAEKGTQPGAGGGARRQR